MASGLGVSSSRNREVPTHETKQKKAGPASPRKPAANHPWKSGWNHKQIQSNTKAQSVKAP
jgi:hypothetical protein